MPRLVFDVDGVIANFVDGMLSLADEMGGYEDQPCCWKHIDKWDFFPASMWQIAKTDAQFWLGLRRMPGVRLKMIVNGIFPDMYLTSRPVGSEVTRHWLAENLFPVARVVTVARPEDKLEFLEQGDILVDDLPSTCRSAAEKGVTALLMDAPFHRGVPQAEIEGLTRITCVSEVAKYIYQ
ncbi:MAG: hypothetical protein ACK4S4_15880 [Pyrinomonadaceae bacterium]